MSSSARACRVAAMAALCGWWLAWGGAGCRTAPPEATSRPGPLKTPSRFDLPAHDFIFVGMDAASLKRLVGPPRETEKAGEAEVWYYAFGVVVLEGGQVIYKYPRSRAQGSPVPALPAGQRSGSSAPDEAPAHQESVPPSP